MGGYQVDQSYTEKNQFIAKWFNGRYINYDAFIRKHVKKSGSILSIASGRAVNELQLIADGFDVTCSDLERPASHEDSIKLFGEHKYIEADILGEMPPKKYESVICIGLICCFNEKEMRVALNNMNRILEKGGILVLELSVSPDNLLSYLLHDIWLRYETLILPYYYNIKGRKFKRVRELHGYRYKTKEITGMLKSEEFDVFDYFSCESLLEFQRSRIIGTLMERIRCLEPVFSAIGKNIPYSRLFAARKM
jgi:SAM-dependent methyltransferase